jgi:protein SMG6
MRVAALNNYANRDRHASSSIQSSSVMDHSSISSYESSTWTLTSSTGTSQSSAPPEQSPDKEGSSSIFIAMLKKVYREIMEFEKKIKDWDSAADGETPTVAITMLKPGVALTELEESEKPDPLRALVAQHKQLAELYHSMITMILQPVPSSMLSFVTKYQLPSRLWSNGIMHCIESLRKMNNRLPGAFEHMTGYIYWSYHFYESLYETSTMNEFMAPYKNSWIEALGDLARFQMRLSFRQPSQEVIGTTAPLTEDALPLPEPRIDNTPPPSIGLAAANAFDLEPEAEIWRKNSQSWYNLVLKETPGVGKLHHYLGQLNVDVENEELRGIYHFVKRCVFPSPAHCTASLLLAAV